MYRGRISRSGPNPNLKLLLLDFRTASERMCHHSTKTVFEEVEGLEGLGSRLWSAIRNHFQVALRDQSAGALRSWAHQCECVFAQRLRRGQQMFALYTRLWEERALKEFLKQMKRRAALRGRELVLGAVGLAYDWSKNRILDEDVKEHLGDLDYIYELQENTGVLPFRPIIAG